MTSLKLPSRAALALSLLALCFSANSAASHQLASSARLSTHDQRTSTTANRVVLASEINGKKVIGTEGTRIGEIRDVVVNLTKGEIRYALLQFEPAFFNADKYYAFPVKTLRMSGTKLTVFYQHKSSQLLEKIRAAKTPQLQQDTNDDRLLNLDQTSRHLPPLANGISIRSSRLVGRHVRGSDGSDIGTISDLGFDMSTSRLIFVVLATAGETETDREMKLLPSTDLLMFEATRDLSMSIDSTAVHLSRTFDRKRWDFLDDAGRIRLLRDKEPAMPTSERK